MFTINVGRDFSRTPGGRKFVDGPDSGELFRQRFLVPNLIDVVNHGGTLTVELDGPRGYLSSFLEEAFGGLIRSGQFTKRQLADHLNVVAKDPFYETYVKLARKYIEDAKPEVALAG